MGPSSRGIDPGRGGAAGRASLAPPTTTYWPPHSLEREYQSADRPLRQPSNQHAGPPANYPTHASAWRAHLFRRPPPAIATTNSLFCTYAPPPPLPSPRNNVTFF